MICAGAINLGGDAIFYRILLKSEAHESSAGEFAVTSCAVEGIFDQGVFL